MQNKQPIEKKVSNPANLSVHSVFYTIQGEGPFCGTPCVFIRLAGCNLQCPLCDTDYTQGRFDISVNELIVRYVADLAPGGLVVITGGEPFRQDLTLLLIHLTDLGYFVQIETNGTLSPPLHPSIYWNVNITERRGVYIVCAPKTGKINRNTLTLACAYKYVGRHGRMAEDGLPTLVLAHSANPQVQRPPASAKLVYLQPADEQDEMINAANQAACVASCLKHGYILQLQIHKLIGVA